MYCLKNTKRVHICVCFTSDLWFNNLNINTLNQIDICTPIFTQPQIV